MRNPYDVLGVPHGASIEQVRAAYRFQMQKYQEDGNQRKIDELNEAYDSIIMNSGNPSSAYSDSGYTSYGDYDDIRAKISRNRLDDAQILLDGMPEHSRDAQWYYLKGTIQQKRGWLEEAANNFATASRMDPANNTYKMAYNKVINARNGGYRTARQQRRKERMCDLCGFDGCDCCCDLLCADACCECMGGDLISCC